MLKYRSTVNKCITLYIYIYIYIYIHEYSIKMLINTKWANPLKAETS